MCVSLFFYHMSLSKSRWHCFQQLFFLNVRSSGKLPDMSISCSNVIMKVAWCQKVDLEMASLSKPPNPLSFTVNTAQNRRNFEEQLKWQLPCQNGGYTEKSQIQPKSASCLATPAKRPEAYIRHLNEQQKVMTRNLRRWWRYFRDAAHHIKTEFMIMSTMDSGPSNKKTETIDAYLTRICMKIYLYEYEKEGWTQGICYKLIRDNFVFSRVDDV